MIVQILRNSLLSLGIGYLCQVTQEISGKQILNEYLAGNIITLLVALLAINSATMGIVLTKLRDLLNKSGESSSVFDSTKKEMLLSIHEQFFLIILAVALLTIKDATFIQGDARIASFFWVVFASIFAYAMLILYDTAKSVIIILDHG